MSGVHVRRAKAALLSSVAVDPTPPFAAEPVTTGLEKRCRSSERQPWAPTSRQRLESCMSGFHPKQTYGLRSGCLITPAGCCVPTTTNPSRYGSLIRTSYGVTVQLTEKTRLTL